MKRIIGIILISILLVGCGNNIAKEAIVQGKESLDKKEYYKALASFDIALDNGSKDNQIIVLKDIINDYLTAKEYFEQKKIEEAQKALEKINSQYSEYLIKDDIKSLQNKLNAELKIYEAINSDIKKLTTFYEEKKYDEAKKMILELSTKPLNQNQKIKVENINNNINTQLKNIEEQKKAEKEKLYNLCKEKLDKVKSYKSEEIGKLHNGSMSEMKQGAYIEYTKWDDALNEIWGVLKTNLPENDMSTLTKAQIKWISYRDKEANDLISGRGGGTLAGLDYLASLTETTVKRCYELIEYLK